MRIQFSPPDITEKEIAAVAEVMRSGWITTGPRTKAFEKKIAEYVETDKAVCFNSATAALELTLRLLGIGPGDEVITSAYTYTASASVVCHVGAKLVLIDTELDSYTMDLKKLEGAISEHTKAIIPVDIAGVPCDYTKIFSLVESKRSLFCPSNELQEAIGRVAVIADAAHAFGAYRGSTMVGRLADFTCFSFHAVKNLTTAEGGAVVWKEIQGVDNQWLYKKYMLLSLHGQSKDALEKNQMGAWEYDIVEPGYKCNMTDIMAAIGEVQLKRYSEILARRKQIIHIYDSALERLPIHVLKHYTNHYHSSGHLYLTRLDDYDENKRNGFIFKMAEQGITTNVHYKPLPMHTAYRQLGFHIIDFPQAFAQYENEVTLPLHTCLTDEQLEYVIAVLETLLRKV